jgi:hypothetical protein
VVLCTYVRRGAIAVCIEHDLGTLQGWPQRREISRGPQAVASGLVHVTRVTYTLVYVWPSAITQTLFPGAAPLHKWAANITGYS